MKVVMLRSNPVAPDPRVEKQAQSLLKSGHSVRIVCWDRRGDRPPIESWTTENGVIQIERCGPVASFGGGVRNLPKLAQFNWFVGRWLLTNRERYDVVHAADFDTAFVAWVVAKALCGKRLIYDIYDYYVDAFGVPGIAKPIVEALDVWVMNSADAVIIVNESRESQIYKARPRKLVVLHNSPRDIGSGRLRAGESGKTFAFVGTLSSGRLILEIIDIFARRADWRLEIGGFGELEDQIRAKVLNLPNVCFHGRVDYESTLSIGARADVLFALYDPKIKNHQYSSPNKLYEAMMLEKPIIVCEGTGVDRFVVRQNIGIAIPYSADDFERAADRILRCDAERAAMGRRARKLFESHYSWEAMEERLITLYREIECKSRG